LNVVEAGVPEGAAVARRGLPGRDGDGTGAGCGAAVRAGKGFGESAEIFGPYLVSDWAPEGGRPVHGPGSAEGRTSRTLGSRGLDGRTTPAPRAAQPLRFGTRSVCSRLAPRTGHGASMPSDRPTALWSEARDA